MRILFGWYNDKIMHDRQIIRGPDDLNSDQRTAVYKWGPPLNYYHGLTKDTNPKFLRVIFDRDLLTPECRFYYDGICRLVQSGSPHVTELLAIHSTPRFHARMEQLAPDMSAGFMEKFGHPWSSTFQKAFDLEAIFRGQPWAPFTIERL